MMSDGPINPYAAPTAQIKTQLNSEDIEYCPPRKLLAGEGNAIIGDAWGLYKQAPIKWTAMTISLFIVTAVFNTIPIIGPILGAIMIVPLFAGLIVGAQKISQGESLLFIDLLAGLQMCGVKLIVFSIVYTILCIAAVLIPFGIFGGTDMLIMMVGGEPSDDMLFQPEIMFTFIVSSLLSMALTIPVLMAFWFAVPLIMFHKMSIPDSLKTSFKSCTKNFLPMFIYGLMMLVWSIIALIPLGLGYLIWLPVLFLSAYTGYRRILTKDQC